MESLSKWNAQVGDLALPKFRALQRWARTRRFVPGPGILWRQTDNGIKVWARRPAAKPHPFRVSWSSGVFRISPGTLDGEPVAIGEVYLDGQRVKEPKAAAGEKPVLPVGKKTPETESWVALRAAGKDKKTPAQLEHVLAVDPALQPLARILWRDGTVERVQQIVRHDLRSWPVPGSGEAVLFWAV